MVDFRSKMKSLQIRWILRYLNTNEGIWRSIFDHYLKPLGSDILLWCNYKTQLLDADLPRFYVDTLNSWRQFVEMTIPNNPTQSIHSQILWNNKNILMDGKSIYDRDFHQVGLFLVKDLIDHDGKLKPFKFWIDVRELKGLNIFNG